MSKSLYLLPSLAAHKDFLKNMNQSPSSNETKHPHFKGKDAVTHVAQSQAQGMITAAEVHGTEIPGPVSAGADAARDTAFLLLVLSLILGQLMPQHNLVNILIIFSAGFLFFRLGRSAWLGWFRLERLHRVLEQEKWEIEHNRDQEREELQELYRAKGFEGQLLEDVTDVLMADGDRLLKVMIEEELGLSLQNVEHPLKQGIGAAVGVLLAYTSCLLGFFLLGTQGLFLANILTIGVAAMIIALYAKNKWVAAAVWNVAFSLLAYFLIFFLFQIIS
ncbi:Uncharacterized protein PHSC3_001151 [Chlamydiales bacterium STE3]|nr:Uncharacterized protein PHSC3_001151 [Chlamydiales bacterium STE3]